MAAMPNDDRRSGHLTPADGNVFADLGFPAEEATALLAEANARMENDIEGTVLEVLPALGLAHVHRADGSVVGINKATPGVNFDNLRPGALLRLEVEQPFSRLVRAEFEGRVSVPAAFEEDQERMSLLLADAVEGLEDLAVGRVLDDAEVERVLSVASTKPPGKA